MKLRNRLKLAAQVLEENTYFKNNGQDLRYDVHCLMEEIDHCGVLENGAKPNKIGCWVIAIWGELKFRFNIYRFAVTGYHPEPWQLDDNDPMGDMMGRNV